MNLPVSVEDQSLLQHEPLRTHIAMLGETAARSVSRMVVSSFVRAMQQDGQAALASKAWAYLLFNGAPSADGSSFEVTDKGEELYKVFFEYQLKLSQVHQREHIDDAHKYRICLLKRGIAAIKLKEHGPNTQDSTQGSGSGVINKSQAEIGDQRPRKGDIVNPDDGLHPTMGITATQPEPFFDTPCAGELSTSSKAAKPSKRSTFEKKRKPSSQKPPVITPSDASEDDEEPSKTHGVAVASSISHRSKRIAPKPSRQPRELFWAKNLVVKKNSARGLRATHRLSAKTSFPSDNLVSGPGKGRQGAEFLFSRRKRRDEKFLNVSAQQSRASFNSRGPRKIQSIGARSSKRRRLALDETGEVSKPTSNLRARFQEHITQVALVPGPASTQESLHVKAKVQRKRTRLEFETAFVVSRENASADSCEFELLGPDPRPSRPLPRKVRPERSLSDQDTTIRRVPCKAPSLEYADHLLRDVASNALVVLQEGVGSDLPDWTQDKEQDAEYDDLDGHDQDEANDVQVTDTTSAPSIVIPKLPVPAPPRIWAQSRQEVCESIEHFRSYHSGVYSNNDIVKGYLLGAFAASRDIFHHGGKLIISHGGGKSESIVDSRKGPRRYRTDRDQEASDRSVRALLNTYKDRRPLVLLADDKYTHFPYDLASGNYTYVVLGYYWISHAWAECQSTRDGLSRIVRWKFAFQWCEGQGDPWWTLKQEMTDLPKPPTPISNTCSMEESSHLANAGGKPNVKCDSCQVQSPSVYKQGWMCLNPLCDVFWTLNGEEPKQLDYHKEFLNLLPHDFERLPDITPARVVETPGGVTTTYAFSKGWHCIQCGRLSCRYKWEHWECSNCGLKHAVNGRIRSPKEFWNQQPHKEFLHSRIGKDSGIVACHLELIHLGDHKGTTSRLTFVLPHDRGKIHLILGTPLSNADADNIFQLYQQQASTGELKLRRYPLRNHRARGALLTNYFSQNSGEPYQYVGGTGNTVPFDEAPDCVRRALAVIKERCSLALRTDIPFNEILSAAYMERQKMAFHSDNEKGLGPVVASLSLGSAAFMHFRPHANAEHPKSRSGHALSLILRHGDVLIMEGNGVQAYYEHAVVPMNFRIAATARCIGST